MPESGHSLQETYRGHGRHPRLMMSLNSVLNPVEDELPSSPGPSNSSLLRGKETEASHLPKKQKLAKDISASMASETRGPVRYRPFSGFSKQIQAEIERFNIQPSAKQISDHPRHIPYSSDKKGFYQKTGREAFEVFQYTFEKIDDRQQHVVMWDYNVGLVRITPFFKCCNYAKTVPGKMLASNPGLKDICHSITGGALAAQGYWMPYRAARAMAKTFCYQIRHALVPLFGTGFVDDCIHPDQEGFGQMIIDPEITKDCVRLAASYREQDEALNERKYEPQSPAFSPPGIPQISTPVFREPMYTASSSSDDSHASDAGDTHEMQQQRSRGVDQAQGQWRPPTPSGSERERRNAFAASYEDFEYLPSPKSDAGRYDKGMAMGGVIPRSHPSVRLPSPQAASAFKLPSKSWNAAPNSPSSLNDSLSYLDNSENRGCDSSDNGSLIEPISPKSKPVAGSLCNRGEPASVVGRDDSDGWPLRRADRQLPRPVPNAASSRGNETCLEGGIEMYKAAWMLYQLHMADAKLKESSHRDASRRTANPDQIQHGTEQPQAGPATMSPARPPALPSDGRLKRRASA